MGFREPDDALDDTVATDLDGLDGLLVALPEGSAPVLLADLLTRLRAEGVGAEWLEAAPGLDEGHESCMWDQWFIDLHPYHVKTRDYYATLWRIGRQDLATAGDGGLREGDPLLAGMLSLPVLDRAVQIGFSSGEREALGLLYAGARILELSGQDAHWHAGIEPAWESEGLVLNWSGLESEQEARGLMALAVLAAISEAEKEGVS